MSKNPHIGEFVIIVLEQAQRNSVALFCKIWQEFLRWRDFGGHFAWIALKIWPSEKFLPNITESHHRIVPSLRRACSKTIITNSPIRGFFDTDSLMSYVYQHHCFIGIFVGPLNTNCIKYQANQKWAKLECLCHMGNPQHYASCAMKRWGGLQYICTIVL